MARFGGVALWLRGDAMTRREQVIVEKCIVCGDAATREIVVTMRDDVGREMSYTYAVCETHRDEFTKQEATDV